MVLRTRASCLTIHRDLFWLAVAVLAMGACTATTDEVFSEADAALGPGAGADPGRRAKAPDGQQLSACVGDLGDCLKASPNDSMACLSDAEQCGLFSVSGALTLTAEQIACAEQFTQCSLTQPADYPQCVSDAEQCGLLRLYAADGGIPFVTGNLPPPPVLTINDAGIALPGVSVSDAGITIALGPIVTCANELLACLAKDSAHAGACADAANQCVADAQP